MLAITGSRDMPEIHDITRKLEQTAPGLERVDIPDAVHMVNMEKPEEFNKAVLDFLDRLGN